MLNHKLTPHIKATIMLKAAPNGFITFISDLCGGHISDKKITELCGLIDCLEPGVMVMVDKRFR